MVHMIATTRRALVVVLLICVFCRADDIDGVQPASLDQPRVNVILRRKPAGQPLNAKTADGEVGSNIEAFLDTGASGVVLSENTAQQLGIKREMGAGKPYEARFADVGVGGGSQFAISEPIFISIAPMAPNVNVDVDRQADMDAIYKTNAGPICAQVGPLNSGADALLAMAMGDMDIIGMPAIRGKIIVMDPRDVNAMTDKIRTYVYDAKAATQPSVIPKLSRHVKLSYVSFADFTQTVPPASTRPTMTANPLIGPDPFHLTGDKTPPVMAQHHGKSSAGSWLLDTGAAASMISLKQAAALGVTYAPDTGGNPRLLGIPNEKQFILSVGGIGGTKKSAGFFLDKLTLTTQEGTPITFVHAPVLVSDISLKDSTGREFTLDGVFGMNFLVASAMVDEGALMPDIGKITSGPFQYIVVDEPAGLLGLEPAHAK
jgi:hypothetical protein